MLGNIQKPISRDPLPVGALTVSFSGGATFTIDNGYLRSNNSTGTALNFKLRDYTLSTLVTAVNAVSGYTASYGTGLGGIQAYALLAGTYAAQVSAVTIPYFTSGLYRLLAPIAGALDDTEADIEAAVRETDLRYADGIWVDRWGALYGVTRSPGEGDAFFARRINFSAAQPKCNGFALVRIIQQALGVSAVVVDVGPAQFQVQLTLNDSVPTVYNTSGINSFIQLYKALGTLGTLSLSSQGTENYSATGITDSLIDSVETPNGEWGAELWGSRPWSM